MDIPKDYLENKLIKSKGGSERGEILEEFLVQLNSNRDPKLKPLSINFVSMKMSDAGLKTNQTLRWFLGDCKEADNFSKYWWWSLNSRNAHRTKTNSKNKGDA